MKKKKFAHIHVKFVRIWYEFRTNFTKPCVFTHIHSCEMRTKFVPISYEFHMNLIQFSHLVHGPGRIQQRGVVTGLGPRSRSIW